MFTNPDGGRCTVDTDDVVDEGDETDNDCNHDTVIVILGGSATAITSHSPNPSWVGQP
jgi:hypothetical protein